MFKSTNSNSILTAIRANRTEKDALKIDRTNKSMVAYRETVESLRLATSRLAASSVASHQDARRDEFVKSVANALKSLMVILGEPDYVSTTHDIDAVLAIVGNFRTDKTTLRREFLPAGDKTFRNSVEKWLGIRANADIVTDAETIKAAKKARLKAEKAAKKAEAKTANAPVIAESTMVEVA